MADLEFIGKRDRSWSGFSVPNLTCPPNVVVGDLMIACVADRNATPTTAAGWTTIATASGNGENDINGRPLTAYKIATAADVPGVTSYTWGPENFNWTVSIAAYRSVVPFTHISSVTIHGITHATAGSGTSISGGSVTAPAASGTLIVCAATNTALNGELCTYSCATMNERCDAHQTDGGGSRLQSGIYDKIGTPVVAGGNTFDAITQLRSESWARSAFIVDYTPLDVSWRGSNSPRVMA